MCMWDRDRWPGFQQVIMTTIFAAWEGNIASCVLSSEIIGSSSSGVLHWQYNWLFLISHRSFPQPYQEMPVVESRSIVCDTWRYSFPLTQRAVAHRDWDSQKTLGHTVRKYNSSICIFLGFCERKKKWIASLLLIFCTLCFTYLCPQSNCQC